MDFRKILIYMKIIKYNPGFILRNKIIDFINNYSISISSRKFFINKFNKLVDIFI